MNDIGIGFTIEDLDYLLENKFTEYEIDSDNSLRAKLGRFADANVASVKGSFFNAVKSIGNIGNKATDERLGKLWSNYRGNWIPLIRELSKARYYRLQN